MKTNLKKILIIASILAFFLVALTGGAIADRIFGFRPLDKIFPRQSSFRIDQKVLNEENVVINVVKEFGPAVVTVSAQTPQRRVLQFSPFGGFSSQIVGGQPQNIGSGFIVSTDGLIVTNKHVVSDTTLSYQVVTLDGKTYDVKQISRDPSNDLAVLKIEASGLKTVEMGDSGNLQVGQFVIAIGTALGEFRNTVTTGVVSGLGRGIEASTSLQGYVEQLDNVIQTDAAINPGNSGGPLLNSAGQVIGINVAVAQGAQNIGFAIPVNTIKEALNQYQANGGFPAKPYLGIQYQMINKQAAILNNVPQGAYVVDVVINSPAEKTGIQVGDIITKIAGQDVNQEGSDLTKVISSKKVGEAISIEFWRNGETKTLNVTLGEFKE